MKKIFAFIAISFFLSSCYDDHSEVIPGQDFIPDEILAEIRENGQPIFEGLNPPEVAGTFQISPLNLVSSNIDDDFNPGYTFSDQITEFTDFNPDNLTLKVNVEQGSYEGEGFGSFISGSGNDFTIYVRVELTDNQGHSTLVTEIYSGTLENNSIRDLYLSVFMVDDGGDPNNAYIENGQGRLFRDGDGFSPRIN